MVKTVLITGGAGFIGSHVADELIAHGYVVRALDNLNPQVHGKGAKRPLYLNPLVDLRVGDVRDPKAVSDALEGVDAVYHFAAAVGVGQSMYEIREYTDVNNVGTAVLLEAMLHHRIRRLVVASSMSIYGEGLYVTRDGCPALITKRSEEQLKEGRWELVTPRGETLDPVPTPETKTPALCSVYALSKFDQEQMCLMVGAAYQIPTVALRFFNVYGPRQALSNPYTGVLAIFAARLLNDRPPLIFEDGQQRRDFVSVYDVARAARFALITQAAVGSVLNIGSGYAATVHEVAEQVAGAMGKQHIRPKVTERYRIGDVRHCFADISLAKQQLGYRPHVTLPEGIASLAKWLRNQHAEDRVEHARLELEARGLTL